MFKTDFRGDDDPAAKYKAIWWANVIPFSTMIILGCLSLPALLLWHYCIPADAASEIEADCNDALQKVMPIYYKAIAAVDRLKAADVTEMARVSTPSPGLMVVAQSLCYFFLPIDAKDKRYMVKKERASDPDVFEYWLPCKKAVLAGGKLLNNMKTYPKDDVPAELIEKMTPLITTPAFSDGALKNAGQAALGIGSWLKAIIECDNAMKVVKPKQA